MHLFDEQQLPRPEYFEIDVVRLAFRRAGRQGPPILMIHGNSCDSAFWGPQIAALSQAHQVIAVDLRGHGFSAKPKQEYTFAGFVDDCAKICEKLDLKQILVVAHSMGGAVAMEPVKRHPGLVRGDCPGQHAVYSPQRAGAAA